MSAQQMTIEQFHASIKAQGAASKLDVTLICPMCGFHQSPRDLIEAGAGENFEDVEKYVGFSCVGRWTGAGSPRNKPDGKPCNWTLGGMFKTHKIEVVADGIAHPRFEVAQKAKVQP